MLTKTVSGLITLLPFILLPMQLLADVELHYNQVHFQVQSRQDVSNDRMEALLQVNEQHADPAGLADRINQTMAWALEVTAPYTALKNTTGGYRTQPVYRKEVIQGWRGSQDLRIKGADFAAIADLIGKLQVRLKIQSINFFVSNELRARVESELIQNALDAYKARARLIADQLGFTLFRIIDLNVSTGNHVPRPQQALYARSLAAEAVAAPAFEAGESTLLVTVDAKVELR